ncbi:hypothetical protein [Escherichia coli]|uniref:hypothetical protein n=1 Tax=Escherichia coli TaxID=562 RepID=UPI0035B5D6AE
MTKVVTFCCSLTTSIVTPARTEVSALLGRMPSAVGYQPTGGRDGRSAERITSTKTGSITSVQAVYVPADDLTDPSPATTFAHLDATVVLSRQIASLGIYRPLTRWTPPAVSWTRWWLVRKLRHRAWRSVHPATLSGTERHHRHHGYG